MPRERASIGLVASPPLEPQREKSDAERLEGLWSGDFGNEYVKRNRAAAGGRDRFWRHVVETLSPTSALEVGCNVGGNLYWLAQMLGPENVAGIDVNEQALETVRGDLPGVEVRRSLGQSIPFDDASYDLVYTTGVLIHIPPSDLEGVMREIHRCSARYILCGEYYADEPTEIPYRGETGALFKRDFGGTYEELFPELSLVEKGFLPAGEGTWDDVTYWIFSK